MELNLLKNIGKIQQEHQEHWKIQKCKNKLDKYKQAISDLTSDTGYLFCYSCYKYGKIGDYSAIKCNICGKWTCEYCKGVIYPKISETEIKVCNPCYKIIPKKSILLCISNQQEKRPISWDEMTSIFNDLEDLRFHFTDIISEYFDSGEYYQYEVNPLTQIFKGPNDMCYFGISFDLKEGEDPDDDIVNLEELTDDLMSYFLDADGFHFDQKSELVNGSLKEKGITLDLSW